MTEQSESDADSQQTKSVPGPQAPRRRRRTSGSGERAAVAGYYAQWRISASLIIAALRREELDWIAVADPEAGQADDLQIGSRDRVDAYQIRSATHPTAFSYGDLTSPRDDEPSLIAQLATSRTSLLVTHGGHVVVHLRTNRLASANDTVPGHSGAPNHFSAFLSEAYARAHRGEAVPARWTAAWRDFCDATGLPADQLDAFVRDCELEFGVTSSMSDGTREAEQQRQDEEQIVRLLPLLVSDPEVIVRIQRAELLTRLGLTDRIAALNRHEFPVDEAAYEPIATNVAELEAKLTALTRGYLGVIGSPGAGKSTLLTATLRRRSDRFVPYYAYVPESQDLLNARGESVNFLHDMVVALERQGFREGASVPSFDRLQLGERFAAQLRRLSDDYVATGRKTVILIDGLDHIDREQHPNRSLLEDLPVPASVPEGVVIVLGSQTDAPFPPSVQAAVQSADRRVEMRPLERAAVLRLVGRVPAATRLSPEQREEVWQKSAGHPLALQLLLRRVEGLPAGADVQAVLDETEPIRTSIEEQYQTYWHALTTNDLAVAHLLALLSRVRPAIDLTWVATWALPAVLARLRRAAYQYFWNEAPDRWHFFHNSFRVFIEHQSAEARPGLYDTEIDRATHRELAERSADASERSPQHWERLFHLSRAGDQTAILGIAVAGNFRAQLEAFRPVEAIRADIEFALRAAVTQRDVVALVRLLLCRAEFSMRSDALKEHPLAELLLRLGQPELASAHVRDGRRLRVGDSAALSVTSAFEAAGLPNEARRIFDAAEPLSQLYNGVEDVRHSGGLDALDAWAATAPRYRTLDAIRNAITGVRVIGRGGDRDDEAPLRARLQHRSARSYAELGRWAEHRMLTDELIAGGDFETWFAALAGPCRDAAKIHDVARAEDLLDQLNAGAASQKLTANQRSWLAELVYRATNDTERVRELLAGLPQPDLRVDGIQAQGLGPYGHLIRLVRVRAALGELPAPRELVPEPDDARHRGAALFERAICAVAQLDGRTWRGDRLAAVEVEDAVLGPLRVLNRPFRETRDYLGWHSMQGARADLAEWIVDVVSRSGDAAVTALKDVFGREWDSPEARGYWSPELRRPIVLALMRHGLPLAWARDQIAALAISATSGSVEERVSAALEQAEAFVALGDHAVATGWLVTALRTSFGVGYRKDHQADEYIEWAGTRYVGEAADAADFTGWAAHAVETLAADTTEGPAQRTAANELLGVAASWSPVRAVRLFGWLSEHEALRHADALAALLGVFARDSHQSPDVLATLVIELVMPLADDAYPALARALIDRAHAAGGIPTAVSVARRLLEASVVSAVQDTRAGWRFGIAEALSHGGIDLTSVGLTEADTLADEERRRAGDRLTLKDGTVLSRAQVRARLQEPGEFEHLLESEADGSGFAWQAVITVLSPEQLVALSDTLATRSHGAVLLAGAAEVLATAGQSGTAWSLASRALELSIPEGWDREWDGGSRLLALQALHKIDPDRARPLVFQQLESDFARALRYPYQIALNLRAVADMLTSDAATRARVVTEAEQHLRALFAYAELDPTTLSDLLRGEPANHATSAAIAELLMLHLQLPIFRVLECTVRAIASVLGSEDRVPMRAALKQALSRDSDEVKERVLAAVHAALRLGADIQDLLPIVRTLCDSDDSAIAFAADEIVSECREQAPAIRKAPLPAQYRIALDPHAGPGLIADTPFRAGEPLRDTEERHQLITPFDHVHLPVLARVANVAEENLLLRTVQLMSEVAPREQWSETAERRLRQRLDATDLQYNFVRPRPATARRALLRAARELERAGALQPSGMQRGILLEYDPVMATRRPEARPTTVARLRHERFTDRQKWIAAPPSVEDVAQRWPDGRIVLAQDAVLFVLDWGRPTEYRRSALFPADLDTLTKWPLEVPMERVIDKRVDSYDRLTIDNRFLAMRHDDNWYTSSGWVAFAPDVAHILGWTLDSSGLFRWRDQAGDIAVESVWWRDGTPARDLLHDVEAGEGWAVLASDPAIREVATLCGGLKRAVAVWRGVTSEGDQELEGVVLRDIQPFDRP